MWRPASTGPCISGTVSEGWDRRHDVWDQRLALRLRERLEAALDARHQSSSPSARDGVHVLVAPAGKVDEEDRVLLIAGAIFIACATACADSSAE